MAYKWKPSASQRKAFAEKMKDPEEAAAYAERKDAKAKKRRSGSNFGYESAGGMYVPTREQHDFCLANGHLAVTPEQEGAFNLVMFGYSCKEKVHHDHIHIVNELRRTNS